MRTRLGTTAILVLALGLAGCGVQRRPVAVAPPPAPVVVASPAPPPGSSPGMLVPQALADGSYPTPNRALTADAALWHLRTGLNVAALSCAGAEGDAVRAAYNRWLVAQRAPLRLAQARDAAGYASTDAYDQAMTRLYNFWSQTPVRDEFCRVAAGIAAELDGAGAADPAVAEGRLRALDRPFADFYAAYDAWRRGVAAPAVIAVATAPAAVPAVPRAATPPRAPLMLDLSSLPLDAGVTGPR